MRIARILKAAVVAVSATAAMTLGTLLPAAPASANNGCLWYSAGHLNPGLQYASCAVGGADWLHGTAWVVNYSPTTSHYIDKIEVFTSLGGWQTCVIKAWLAPGKSRSCFLPVVAITPPALHYVYARPYFWVPALGAYDWRQAPSLPVYVT